MSSVEQWGTAHDAEAAPVCRALLVAALEKFYHSCSQGLRFIAAATVQGADDAPNVLRVPSSPPLLSAPLLQRAVSRQHAECGPQTRHHVADCNTSFGTRAPCVYQSFRRVLPSFPEASVVAHAPEVALFCAPRVSTHRPCVPRMCQAAVRTARCQCAPPCASGHQCRVHHQRAARVGCWASPGAQAGPSAFPASARQGDKKPRALTGVRRAYHPFE